MTEKANRTRRGRRWPTAVDLFCGCGGVTTALRRRHFRVLAAVDSDPWACQSYRLNHPSVNIYEKDIKALDPLEIARSDLRGETLDLLVVCAPCQPFSSQNRHSGNDPRAALILEAIRFAKVLDPTVIFFENVPGIANEKNASIIRKLKRQLTALGYLFDDPTVVDASHYGVPQRRRRCIMTATKNRYLGPDIVRLAGSVGRTTVREAIGRLPALRATRRDCSDPLHFARNHSTIALKRLKYIPKDGGSRDSLPKHLRLSCHTDSKSYSDVYGRMRWDDIAPTLTTGCTDITKGRFAHPRDDRAITLREAALLQTFPLDYKFAGSPGQIAAQIGNAVPVRFIEAIIPAFRLVLNAP